MLLKIPGFGKILGNPGRVFKDDVGERRRRAAGARRGAALEGVEPRWKGVERDLTNKLKQN
jgi:hypothetical protein